MNPPRRPSVLFVFYTHTEQSRRVADAMADVLRERSGHTTPDEVSPTSGPRSRTTTPGG
jgi:hypothetical protein